MQTMTGLAGFSEFTHVLFATNSDRTPYRGLHYHCIMLPDIPEANLKARFLPVSTLFQPFFNPVSTLYERCLNPVSTLYERCLNPV